MAGLFGSKPKPPPAPKVVRMPTSKDPNAEKAASRYRQAALDRRGRRYTIMTDALKEMTGSSGKNLGS